MAEKMAAKVGSQNTSNNATLLWTNSSPTSGFSPQTIPLDLSKYDAVLVFFEEYTSGGRHNDMTSQICLIGATGLAFTPYLNGTKIEAYSGRKFEVASDGITFSAGQSQSTVMNGNCVPYQIYGLKWN